MSGIVEAVMDPLQHGFMVRALIVSVLIGLACPVIGSYVITRNLAFMGDALAHAILPGVVVGLLLGLSPFIVALPVGIVIAILIGYLSRRSGLSEDVSIGVIFAGMLALGLTLLSSNSEVLDIHVEDLLMGQLLTVDNGDVYLSLGVTGVVLTVLYVLHGRLGFTSFDPVGARVVGITVDMFNYALLVLLALVIVIGMQAVGIVLVMAMLVTPAATAYLLAGRFTMIMYVSAAIGVVSAVLGLYISFHFNLPAGPVITLVATCLFSSVAVFRKRLY